MCEWSIDFLVCWSGLYTICLLYSSHTCLCNFVFVHLCNFGFVYLCRILHPMCATATTPLFHHTVKCVVRLWWRGGARALLPLTPFILDFKVNFNTPGWAVISPKNLRTNKIFLLNNWRVRFSMSLLAFPDMICLGKVGDDENWKHFLMCAGDS